MKSYSLRCVSLIGLGLLACSIVNAQDISQDKKEKDNDSKERKELSEIIIKQKNDKDKKLTIEIKDGKISLNGKPLAEYDDDDVSVTTLDGDEGDMNMRFFAPGPPPAIGPRSPFRGGVWNFNGNPDIARDMEKRPFLGVASEKAENSSGAKIQSVTKASAAEKAGLQKGDIITKINDTKIEGPAELTETIRKFKPEDKITVTYIRNGKEAKTTAVLGKMKFERTYQYKLNVPNENFVPGIPPVPGMDNFDFSFNERRPRLGIKAQDTEDGKGVKVIDVDDDSPADKAGIKEDDIITQFDGKPVNDAQALAEMARDGKEKTSFNVTIIRDGKTQELQVKIPKKLKTADL